MAEQDNTPQGGFGQGELLSFHALTDADAEQLDDLLALTGDRQRISITAGRLRNLLGPGLTAVAIVRRGDASGRMRIVAMAECSYTYRIIGNVGVIAAPIIAPSVPAEHDIRIRTALIDRLLEWCDERRLYKVETIGPAAGGGARAAYRILGFNEIDTDGHLYTRYASRSA